MSKKIKVDYDIAGELLATTIVVRGGLATEYMMADGSRTTATVSSPLTTKGDLYTWDTNNQRLPVGTNGYLLSANSATATGLEWIVAPTGGGASLTKDVTQTTHGLSVGNAIRHNGTIWVKAQADSLANSGTIGVVSVVTDANNFTYTFGAFLVQGTWSNGVSYFLSPSVAGAIITEPTYVAGEVREFIGTGTPDGLLLEFDLGDVVETVVTGVAWGDITGKPTTLSGYAISDTMASFDTACSNGNFAYQGQTIVVGGHGTGTTDEVINVCYGTSATPPAVGTVTEGALYIQYIA